jgi:predicted metal-binding membrane protein
MHQYHDETSGAPAVTMAALTTVGLGAVAWVVAVQLMTNVDMTTPGLGSFTSFINMWMWMMAAMMLPGAAPAAFRYAHASDSVRAILLFVGSYLAVWTLVGVALYTVYPVYRPYGSFAPERLRSRRVSISSHRSSSSSAGAAAIGSNLESSLGSAVSVRASD